MKITLMRNITDDLKIFGVDDERLERLLTKAVEA